MNRKYLHRKDSFKLLAAQQELFHAHLAILHALNPDISFDWWPILANNLVDGQQRMLLLSYFGNGDWQVIRDGLELQMRAFSMDAKAACRKWECEYPEDFETAVFAHIDRVLGELQS